MYIIGYHSIFAAFIVKSRNTTWSRSEVYRTLTFVHCLLLSDIGSLKHKWLDKNAAMQQTQLEGENELELEEMALSSAVTCTLLWAI